MTFLEELHYYPFGMLMEGIGTNPVTVNAYKYNSKELNADLGLNWYDYGARWYDPAVGRWWSVDPMAEKTINVSTYAYVLNNPTLLIDPNGMLAGNPFEVMAERRSAQEARNKERDRQIKKSGDDAMYRLLDRQFLPPQGEDRLEIYKRYGKEISEKANDNKILLAGVINSVGHDYFGRPIVRMGETEQETAIRNFAKAIKKVGVSTGSVNFWIDPVVHFDDHPNVDPRGLPPILQNAVNDSGWPINKGMLDSYYMIIDIFKSQGIQLGDGSNNTVPFHIWIRKHDLPEPRSQSEINSFHSSNLLIWKTKGA